MIDSENVLRFGDVLFVVVLYSLSELILSGQEILSPKEADWALRFEFCGFCIVHCELHTADEITKVVIRTEKRSARGNAQPGEQAIGYLHNALQCTSKE